MLARGAKLARAIEPTGEFPHPVDAVLYLQSAEIESRADVRACLVRHTRPLLELQGERLVRWLSRIVRVTGVCLSATDEGCREDALGNLAFVLGVAGERIRPYARDLLEGLFRLLYELCLLPAR